MAQVTSNLNQLTNPGWAGDFLSREHLLPGGAKVNAAQFNATDAVVVVTSGAAQGATAVPVTALSGPIPSGTVLDFGGAKFARLTAAAATGATSLTVTALVNTDTATYAGTGTKQVTIPSGTPVGRTLAERNSGAAYGPADPADDEVYLLAFDVSDARVNNNAELYRHASLVKENFLPNYAGIVSGVLTKIRANYECVRGVA